MRPLPASSCASATTTRSSPCDRRSCSDQTNRKRLPRRPRNGVDLFLRKLDRHNHAPRLMVDGAARELTVVPRQSLVDVTRAAHGVTCEFGHAPKNVDKPLPRAAHERSEWHLSRHQKICGIGEVSDLESARYAVWARDDGGTEGRY